MPVCPALLETVGELIPLTTTELIGNFFLKVLIQGLNWLKLAKFPEFLNYRFHLKEFYTQCS